MLFQNSFNEGLMSGNESVINHEHMGEKTDIME